MTSRSLSLISPPRHSSRVHGVAKNSTDAGISKGDDYMSLIRSAVESRPSRKTHEAQSNAAPTEACAQDFKNATRIQESLTSEPERRALLWLAARMPSWVTSDQLTLLGFVAMILAGASYFLARWHLVGLFLAAIFLGLNWFGDSLDGTVARVRNRLRPRYGFYVDHMVDSFGAVFLMSGLGASTYVDWRIAMGMLVAFFVLSIESYLAAYTLGIFRLSFAKFGPTEIRILLALGSVVLWFHPNLRVPGISCRLFDVAGLIAVAAMGMMAIVATACHTAKLYRQETPSR
jgi:phosphatidylglycerophosphate synthase